LAAVFVRGNSQLRHFARGGQNCFCLCQRPLSTSAPTLSGGRTVCWSAKETTKGRPMDFCRQSLLAGLVAVLCGTMASPSAPASISPEYSDYEKLVLNNVARFHATFNAHDFAKNGEMVADNIHVNSNGVELNGRAAFVERIARFIQPFPDVQIHDVVTIVNGNKAAVRYVITGTQDGDLETPEGVIRATHKHVHVDGAEFFTLDENAKVVDLVTIERLDQLFQQLQSSP
jgi:predicted ester cyclase